MLSIVHFLIYNCSKTYNVSVMHTKL